MKEDAEIVAEPAVYIRLIDEADEVNCVLGFQLKLVDLLRANQDVVPLRVLVAFDDLLVGNFLETLGRNDAFEVPDRRPRGRMDLPEGDRVLHGNGGVQLHRDDDQAQAEVAGPQTGHGTLLT
jgi:hypothetical protein